jgi:hypothetical protein
MRRRRYARTNVDPATREVPKLTRAKVGELLRSAPGARELQKTLDTLAILPQASRDLVLT